MIPVFFFWYLAIATTGLSLVAVTRKNPIHSVFYMLALFFHVAAIFLFLNAEFLAAVQVVLYAGAILVLFLFVITVLNLKREIYIPPFMSEWPVGLALGCSIIVFLLLAIRNFVPGPSGIYSIEAIREETHTRVLGKAVYTEYLLPFEIASIILLIAIVGAMVLAKKK